MGVDIRKKHIKKKVRREPKSENVYLRTLVKLYKFLARRTDSEFNRIVYQRMCKSLINRPPISLSKLANHMEGKGDTIAVVVGIVTDDERMMEVPKMTVCALRFTRTARARLIKAGGQCLTFDQLAVMRPTGANTFLLRGRRNREAQRHFGAAGLPGSHAKPHVRSKGRKFERARGARRNKGRGLGW